MVIGVEFLKMLLFQRSVVGVVAETIKEGTNFHALFSLLAQDIKQQSCDGVVTEVEILQMHTALGMAYGFKHVGKLLFT